MYFSIYVVAQSPVETLFFTRELFISVRSLVSSLFPASSLCNLFASYHKHMIALLAAEKAQPVIQFKNWLYPIRFGAFILQ